MKLRYWKGDKVSTLPENHVFVFGSNPEGRHGMGAAKQAMKWGAVYGKGRGLHGSTYALVTKNLKAGYTEACTGITYNTSGMKSVSSQQLKCNIFEMYLVCIDNPDLTFIVPYKCDDTNLNGYSGHFMFSMFMGTLIDYNMKCPDNILFHNSLRGLAYAD